MNSPIFASEDDFCRNIQGNWTGRWVMEAGYTSNFVCSWYTDAWGSIDDQGKFQFRISLHSGAPSSMCPQSGSRLITGTCKNAVVTYDNGRYWGGFTKPTSISIDGESDYGWLVKS